MSMKFIPHFLLLVWMKRLMPLGKRHPRDLFFIISVLCALVFLVPITAMLIWQGMQVSAFSCVIAWSLVALSLGLWRRNVPLLASVLVFECSLLSLILFNVTFLGGVISPVLIWLGIVPILPFFITRRIWCYVFLVFSFCSVIAILWLQLHGYIASPPGTSIPQIWSGGLMYSLFVFAQMILVALVDANNLLRLRKAKHNNERLRMLTQALEQVSLHKDRFLFTVSHEMRTPLNAVYGFLELLRQRDDLPEVAAIQIGHAASSATHLLTIINDLLDYSQIRQGYFSLVMEPVDLPLLLQETHQILEEQAERKQLGYVWQAITPLPRGAMVDPHRLTQILLNLLGNAIKFTHTGEVRMEVAYHGLDEYHGDLQLQVIDNGVGIPSGQLERIFEPFVQLMNKDPVANDSALRGNGLGLAITCSLVHAWGGQISAHNRPEGGSLFKVRLPIETTQPRADASPNTLGPGPAFAALHQRHCDFLVVDDHAMNRMVARAAIQRYFPDSRIDEAQNGEQALEKMAAHLYDLVLMDIVMHDISGIDVVRIVRDTFPEPYRHVPVVALTANLANDIVKRCEACNIAAIVPKPFKVDMLIQTMEKHMRHVACAV